MMKTLLFATAVVTALAAAAPAVARGPHGYYRSDYRYYYAPYFPSGAYGFHGYVPAHYATYCDQLRKAC
jgi:hypothetical protein